MRRLVSAFLLVTAAYAFPASLLKNSDFNATEEAIPNKEDGYGVWQFANKQIKPVGWSLNQHLTGTIEMPLQPDGGHSLKLSGTFAKNREAHLMCPVPWFTKGDNIRYRLRGKARGTGGAIGFYVISKEHGTQVVPAFKLKQPTEKWIDFDTFFYADGLAGNVSYFYVAAYGNSILEVDDIMVERQTLKRHSKFSFNIENNHVIITIGGDGKLVSLKRKSDGKNFASQNAPVFYYIADNDIQVQPLNVKRNGDYINIDWGTTSNAQTDLFVKEYHDYFTFTVARSTLPNANILGFFTLKLKMTENYGSLLNTAVADGFTAFLQAANDKCQATSNCRLGLELSARAHAQFGIAGAKAIFGAIPRKSLETVLENIEIEQGLYHPVRDGIWLRKHPGRTASYMMTGNVTENTIDDIIDFAKGGFGCIEITDGWWESTPTYNPDPKRYPNGVGSLKAIADKAHAAGLQLGLHAMQGMVGWGGTKGKKDIHVTPVADDRLKQSKFTSLAKLITPHDTSIKSAESLTEWPAKGDLFINGEVVRYASHTDNSFEQCKRGLWDSIPCEHPAGTRIGLLLNCFPIWDHCIYTPDINSTLFDEIVERLAYVFNESGADMAYFDAGEEWGVQPPHWHNTGRFAIDFMKRLHKPIFLGGNNLYTNLSWHAIVRGSPYFDPIYYGRDVYTMRFKGTYPLGHANNLMVGDVGWFRPHVWSLSTNAVTPDEVELLCLKAVATKSPISFQISHNAFYINKRTPEMLRYIRLCDAIKRDDLLPESVRRQMWDSNARHILVPTGDNKWDILQRHYDGFQVLHANDKFRPSATVTNPFATQSPTLRLYASPQIAQYGAPDNIVLADFAKGTLFTHKTKAKATIQPASEKAPDGASAIQLSFNNSTKSQSSWVQFTYDFPAHLNLTANRPIGLWVKANACGGILNVQLTSTSAVGSVREHYIDLDFNGWRFFVLDRPEDVRYFDFKWPYGPPAPLYRRYPYNDVVGLALYLNALPASASANVLVGRIEALREYPNGLNQPAITANGARISIPFNMKPHQYVELLPDGNATLFNRNGDVVCNTRTKPLPKFSNKTSVTLEAKPDSPKQTPRAEVTFMFTGQSIASFSMKPDPRDILPPEPILQKGDKGALRLMARNRELAPLTENSLQITNYASPTPEIIPFNALPSYKNSPAFLTIKNTSGAFAISKNTQFQKSFVINKFTSPDIFALTPTNTYAKCVSGADCVTDKDGFHAAGVSQSIIFDGKFVRFNASSQKGNWASRGFRFDKLLNLSDYNLISLNVNGDAKKESLRIQFWDVNGRYADWVKPINFKGWKQFYLQTADASPGFDWTKVKYFILLFNNIPINDSCSVAISELTALRVKIEETTLNKLTLVLNGTKIPLPFTIAQNETALIKPDGTVTIYSADAKPLRNAKLKTSISIRNGNNTLTLLSDAPNPAEAAINCFCAPR